MSDKKEFNVDFEGNVYKLSIYIDKKELNLVISSPNQFIPITYEKNLKKSDLQRHSNYFNKFSSLNEMCNDIINLIEEQKYSIKKDPSSTGFIFLNLYPEEMSDMNEESVEIEFKIPLIRISSNSIVENLFEIITDMSIQINNLNEKVRNLESDHVSQKQMTDSNNNIEKISLKLNKFLYSLT